ncbi:alpha-amylase family glycosyl hydrolase [Oceanobacter sp. 5_MG-2023]|uniref:alpha-amylase family glycosyl hydrolase n=1 Tax=Oceanobacter sp. 5_MG-2023 TaxID=3062645 RepID=UPI0026E43C1E|nr:alpha-amylase family glycosyl hydrolase [Oceanobacter sp. 5_MG-2023]MDO6681464.1 alpha-amylase family glycosyl hydrolase [Oceanobacter sp. 5_MG-2023]
MNWWQHGVVYQIYPRSFQDSNNDGIGDLQGLISRLDYLNDGTPDSLGIDAIWLSPVYPSPMLDLGYDICDYQAIDPVFGTLADFDQLLQQAHQRDIRIILDLVANHTSDQHPWFIDSCQPGSSKADWYLWHEGNTRPNNWQACFGGSGWSWHPVRKAWYFHSFLPQQPDLNWRHPEVQQAIQAVMEFWLARGVDGFRLDVVNLFYKARDLQNNPTDWLKPARPYDRQRHIHDRDQPEMHELLKQMRSWVDQYPDRMMVGEIFIADSDDASLPASYCGNGDELHLAFNLAFLRAPFSARAFRAVIHQWIDLLGHENWPNYTLSNHDIKRHISRYAAHSDRTQAEQPPHKHSLERARLLAMLLLTLRGTPFLYYGEEIGMPEQPVSLPQRQDPVGKRYWPFHPGRDGCRRPMMWQIPNTFSSAASWLPERVIEGTSVTDQSHDPDSLLSWYRHLIWLRKRTPALYRGKLKLIGSPDEVLAYERCEQPHRLLVLLNFSSQPQPVNLHHHAVMRCLANSHASAAPAYRDGSLLLEPLQALILEINPDFPQRASVAP